jgi:hypothetical protein
MQPKRFPDHARGSGEGGLDVAVAGGERGPRLSVAPLWTGGAFGASAARQSATAGSGS